MPAQQVRANFPKMADGHPIQPTFVQQVDAAGNLAVPDSGLTPQGGTAIGASSGNVANAIAASNAQLCIRFIPPHPASAANTAITVSCPALGAGNLNNVVNVRGIRV